MRTTNSQIITAGDMSTASITSLPRKLDQIFGFAVQAVWTGAPVGDFKLQISCDPGAAGFLDGTGVTNWIDYTDSTHAAGGGAGNYIWNISDPGFLWVRLVYTKTSGTGTVNAIINEKGI